MVLHLIEYILLGIKNFIYYGKYFFKYKKAKMLFKKKKLCMIILVHQYPLSILYIHCNTKQR